MNLKEYYKDRIRGYINEQSTTKSTGDDVDSEGAFEKLKRLYFEGDDRFTKEEIKQTTALWREKYPEAAARFDEWNSASTDYQEPRIRQDLKTMVTLPAVVGVVGEKVSDLRTTSKKLLWPSFFLGDPLTAIARGGSVSQIARETADAGINSLLYTVPWVAMGHDTVSGSLGDEPLATKIFNKVDDVLGSPVDRLISHASAAIGRGGIPKTDEKIEREASRIQRWDVGDTVESNREKTSKKRDTFIYNERKKRADIIAANRRKIEDDTAALTKRYADRRALRKQGIDPDFDPNFDHSSMPSDNQAKDRPGGPRI